MNPVPRALRPVFAIALLAAISIASEACGHKGRGGLPVINSFTASPVSVPANGGSVTFQWDVTGASALSISPAIGAVTGTATTAIITLDGNYTLTATNSRGSSTSSIHIAVGAPMTVHGTVYFAAPIAGATVVALGQASHGVLPAQTDTNGQFTIDGVIPPYDLAVSVPSAGPGYIVYLGLNRPDPRLTDLPFTSILWPSSLSENLSGTVAGASGFPTGPGVHDVVSFTSPESQIALASANPTTSAWNLSVAWTGKSSTTLNVRALEYAADPAFSQAEPLSFSRFGSKQVTIVSDGGTFSGIDVPMAPVASSGVISGTYTIPPGYGDPFSQEFLDFGGPADNPDAMPFTGRTVTNGTFSLHAPSITGATIALSLFESGPTGFCNLIQRGLTPGQTGVSIDFPESSQLLLPPDGATGVTADTLFAATGRAQTVTGLFLITNSAPVEQFLAIYGARTSGKLPDLREIGFELQPSATYAWSVSDFGPAANMDDFTGPWANLPAVQICNANTRQFQVHP